VAYASAAANAAGDAQRQQGAEFIQTAALLGFLPARTLVVRNYPQSEPMRRAVAAPDVIRYATAYLATPIIPPDSQAQFEALALHSAASGQIDLFIAQLLEGLREDRRPQLSHRIDTLFDLLGSVRGACRALARALSVDPIPDECTRPMGEALRRHIENSKPLDREADSKRRGFARLVPTGTR